MKKLANWHRVGRAGKGEKASPRDEELGIADNDESLSPSTSPRGGYPTRQGGYSYLPLRASVESEGVGPTGAGRLRVSVSSPPPPERELTTGSDGPMLGKTALVRKAPVKFGKQTTQAFTSVPGSTGYVAENRSRRATALHSAPSSSLQHQLSQIDSYSALQGSGSSLFGLPTATLDTQGGETGRRRSRSGGSQNVFGSFFDLTTERLTHIFQEFDHDGEGRVSYEALRQGLLHWAGIHIDDDVQFNQLITLLDADYSHDISFDEFEGGVRMLMMQQLFQGELDPDWENENQQVGGVHPVVVVDYNALSVRKTTVSTALQMHEFMFGNRDAWVSSRWIDAFGVELGHVTLKRLAVKYRLHPLALEAAISTGLRPKVEKYSTHYCIIAPLFSSEFSVVPEAPQEGGMHSAASWIAAALSGLACIYRRCLFCCCSKRRMSPGKERTRKHLRISHENVCMFICCTPPNDDEGSSVTCDTLITFQREKPKGKPWERVLRELGKSYAKLRQYDAQYLAYTILESVVERLYPVVQTCRDCLDEDRELLVSEGFLDLGSLYEHKDQLHQFLRSIRPFSKMLTHIIDDDEICEGVTLYLRELRDNVEALEDDMRTLVVASETLEGEYEKFHSSKTERTLYRLSVMSSIFLPAQFFTGVFGMNFDNMPELHWSYSYYIFWIGTIIGMLHMLIYFRCGQLS